MTQYKKCTKCGELKEFDLFSPNKRMRLGISSWCRSCKGKLDSDSARKYPEKYAETKRKSYERNKARALERSKQWDKDHPKEALARHTRYNKRFPEKVNLRAQNRRMKVRNAPGRGVTPTDWKMILSFYGNKCLKCGSTKKITIDHVIPIDLGGWHDPTNIQPLCLSCNSGKQSRSCSDYRPWDAKARAWLRSSFK